MIPDCKQRLSSIGGRTVQSSHGLGELGIGVGKAVVGGCVVGLTVGWVVSWSVVVEEIVVGVSVVDGRDSVDVLLVDDVGGLPLVDGCSVGGLVLVDNCGIVPSGKGFPLVQSSRGHLFQWNINKVIK